MTFASKISSLLSPEIRYENPKILKVQRKPNEPLYLSVLFQDADKAQEHFLLNKTLHICRTWLCGLTKEQQCLLIAPLILYFEIVTARYQPIRIFW